MKTLLQILQLLPELIKAVLAVETLLPLPGRGPEKLTLVLGVIEDTQADVKGILPTITKVIARIVGFANATGVFGSKAAPPLN